MNGFGTRTPPSLASTMNDCLNFVWSYLLYILILVWIKCVTELFRTVICLPGDLNIPPTMSVVHKL